MPSGEIYLYFRDVPKGAEWSQGANAVGRLWLRETYVQESPPAVILKFEHQRSFDPKGQDARWIALSANIEDVHRSGQTVFGRVLMETQGSMPTWPDLGQSTSYPEWTWRLNAADIEALDRAWVEAQAKVQLQLRLRVEGIVQIGGNVVGIRSPDSSRLQLARSEWDDMVDRLGYRTSPSIRGVGGTLSAAAWSTAETNLKDANRQLRDGEARDALGTALDQFEALVTQPYVPNAWDALLPSMPAQKRDGLAAMLGGVCTYLNKVGHHRSRSERDAEGQLIEMPVDHWEGELGLGISQLLLTYAVRMSERGKSNDGQ